MNLPMPVAPWTDVQGVIEYDADGLPVPVSPYQGEAEEAPAATTGFLLPSGEWE